MKEDLHITLIQSSLHWENRDANIEMFSEKIRSIHEPTDLILLPEMFSTGFSMQPEQFAETMDGEMMKTMRAWSTEKNAVICGSLMMKDGDKFYNRLVWIRPDGTYDYYDKRHLFGLGEEHKHYSAGHKKLLVELKGWKILPLICYDLRFPAWCRNTDQYDVLIFVANWPERRIQAWKTLLEARAIENQSYVIGVNRVGNDGNEMYYPGESCLVDPRGEVLFRQGHFELTHSFSLSYHHLNHIRESLPFLKDRDVFEIKETV
jgi:predicted amidohydrolase